MENPKFKQFVIEVFEASKERTVEEKVWGATIHVPSLYGRVYIANSSPSFQEIKEGIVDVQPMKKYLDSYSISPSMLYLKARNEDTEEQIYEWEYVNHEIKENEIVVETKKKTIAFPI